MLNFYVVTLVLLAGLASTNGAKSGTTCQENSHSGSCDVPTEDGCSACFYCDDLSPIACNTTLRGETCGGHGARSGSTSGQSAGSDSKTAVIYACYIELTRNNEGLTSNKGCMEIEECMNIENGNDPACSVGDCQTTCTFCCYDHNYCNYDRLPYLPDPCEPNPCDNDGVCNRHWLGYTCRCPIGFYGEHCENEWDACHSDPCDNGGSCVSEGRGYRCDCLPGYIGDNCEDDCDRCDPDPCHNGGVCVQLGSLIRCRCPTGYTGSRCDHIIDPCDANPCRNGGTCNSEGTSYECTCPEGYTGDNCEQEADPCEPNPCEHGGVCVGYNNVAYVCLCPRQYEGVNCETERDPCLPDPCDNGGRCIPLGYANYWCLCPEGYTGWTCSQPDPCYPQPCHNDGVCSGDGAGGYNCDCPSGFDGTRCEHAYYDCGENNPCTPTVINPGQYYYPHEDPHNFVQCDDHGQCFVMPCGAGLIWDEEAYTCNWP